MQEKNDEMRHRILVEAQHLFLRHGYARTSQQMIAKQAGVSKSGLYRYFSSKEDIFYELTATAAEGLRRLVLELRDRRPARDVHEVLLSIEAVSLFLHEKYGLLLIMEHAQGTRYEELRPGLTDLLAARIAPVLRAGDERDMLARVAAKNIVSGLVEVLKSPVRSAELREWLSRVLTYHTHGLYMLAE